ncbi:hypothetical protein DFAR_1550002 [Desulfarculales bacterium]
MAAQKDAALDQKSHLLHESTQWRITHFARLALK